MMTEEQTSLLAKLTKNPIIKSAAYLLVAMAVGIGVAWVLLGIASPVLLSLLILKW